MSNPQTLLQAPLILPSLPEVMFRLNELLANGLPSMGQVSEVVSEDPALTAQVLRLVNSALYGFRGKIDSIQRAVTLIGVRELRSLALAASVTQVFEGIPRDVMDMNRFWRHSLFCGLLARGLAEALGQREVDRFFVMGLLHDLGTLVMVSQRQAHAVEAYERSRRERVPLVEAEQAVFGYDHADVGAALARQWQLPNAIADVIGGHHSRQPQGPHKLATAMVRLADAIAETLSDYRLGLGHPEGLVISDWELVGLRDDLRIPLIEGAQRRFDGARQSLGIAA